VVKPRINGVSFGSCGSNIRVDASRSPALMAALGKLGCSRIRLGVPWDLVNPEPGVFDWTKLDAEVKAITDAGMLVYANPTSAPRWAAEGKPTYLWPAQLMADSECCVAWVRPYMPPDGPVIRFAAERDYCSSPAHIDPEAMSAFGAALGERYKGRIQWYGIWNEPGFPIFYPPSRGNPEDPLSEIDPEGWPRQLCAEVIAPFTEGVRMSHPSAKFVGPEAESWWTMERILALEAEQRAHWFDVISFHPYAWGEFPGNSYDRMDKEFMPCVERWRNGRDAWISEINGDGDLVEYMREISKRAIECVIWLNADTWFEKDLSLNERGLGVESLFKATRRRAV
jgi:hypothetical protein